MEEGNSAVPDATPSGSTVDVGDIRGRSAERLMAVDSRRRMYSSTVASSARCGAPTSGCSDAGSSAVAAGVPRASALPSRSKNCGCKNSQEQRLQCNVGTYRHCRTKIC